MLLELRDIRKSFDRKTVLHGLSLDVAEGDIVVLLGPSGCGKTTLLRIIAGLELADGGRILMHGQDLDRLPVHRRGIGMVFQDFALFPHKNVAQNVEFGLRMLGWDETDRAARVSQVLALVGLQGFGDRPVFELSGGEQQRVALARSLAPSPRLLLLDEPLGSLDRALRERLMGELRSILKRAGTLFPGAERDIREVAGRAQDAVAQAGRPVTQGITSIYVTHDQEEAFAIADRITVMNEGRIEQEGTPVELYGKPRSQFVARFLGMENLLPAQVISLEPPLVDTILGPLQVAQVGHPISAEVTLLIRPEAAFPVTAGQKAVNLVRGRIESLSFRGRHQVATMVVPVSGDSAGEVADALLPATISPTTSPATEYRLRLTIESSMPLKEGPDDMTISLDPAKLIVLECC